MTPVDHLGERNDISNFFAKVCDFSLSLVWASYEGKGYKN